MFQNLSVKAKVMGGFALVIIFTLIIGITSVLILNNFNTAASTVDDIINSRHVNTHNCYVASLNMDDAVYYAAQDPQAANVDEL